MDAGAAGPVTRASMSSFAAKALLLAAAMIAAVAGLQRSLILVYTASAGVHWAAVLFGVPVLAGLGARLASPRRPYALGFAASLVAAVVLYLLYARYFWRVQPTPLQGGAFFGALSLSSVFGVSLAGGRRARRTVGLRTVLLVAYHALAVIAGVVTIVGFLRGR